MNTERSFDDLLDDFLNDELELDSDRTNYDMVEQPLCAIMSDLVPYTSRGQTYYVPTACRHKKCSHICCDYDFVCLWR